MVKFLKIKGEGFGSFVTETKFKFDRPGLNIIIAKNGSGKTTVFNLLNWVLYGSVLKDIKDVSTWQRFRPTDWKGTIGRLKFKKDGVKYEIIRCKDSKHMVEHSKGKDRLLLLREGLDISERNKKEVQAQINVLIGYTSDLFKNTILFGQKLKRLSQESGPEKKKVFEEAFESKFIKDSRDKGLLKLEIKQQEFNEIDLKLIKLKTKRDSTKESYLELKENKDRAERIKQKELKEINKKITEVGKVITEYSAVELKTREHQLEKAKRELHSYTSLTIEIKDLEGREFRESNLKDDIEHRIGIQDNQIRMVREKYSSIFDKCPRCGQKLSPEKLKEEKQKLLDQKKSAQIEKIKLESQLEDQLGIINALNKDLNSKRNDKEKIFALTDKIRNLEREVKTLTYKDDNFKGGKKELNSLQERLAYINKNEVSINLEPSLKILKEVREKIAKIKPRYKELKIDIKHLKWAIDDVLGNKGLKAYIFDTMLKELNELLKYYEQFIGYRIEFNVDLESANKDIYTICYIGEHPCFYEELSGAQSQLVDIATAFALNDLVTQGRPVNIMVFDEVMDNLDQENEDIVYELITDKSFTTNLFLITHNIDLQSASSKVIRMSYDKKTGQSIMKLL